MQCSQRAPLSVLSTALSGIPRLAGCPLLRGSAPLRRPRVLAPPRNSGPQMCRPTSHARAPDPHDTAHIHPAHARPRLACLALPRIRIDSAAAGRTAERTEYRARIRNVACGWLSRQCALMHDYCRLPFDLWKNSALGEGLVQRDVGSGGAREHDSEVARHYARSITSEN
ncbi:hypothetical protein FB451DRAFT_1363205 [Mycena latifolia]|nr:hypothetical protein FB451DRAFT_1363205 [Mycena latifolia]